MILREAVYLDFAKQLQWPLTEVPVSLCFKKMVVLFNSAPSVSAGDAIHRERTNFGPYGCYRKRTPTSATKCYFLSLTLSNLVKNTMQSYVMVQGNEHQPSNL